MKLFLFPDLDKVSNRYHSNGGVVVLARSREHAEQLCAEHVDETGWESEPCPIVLDWTQVREWDVHQEDDEQGHVWVMPDAGCC